MFSLKVFDLNDYNLLESYHWVPAFFMPREDRRRGSEDRSFQKSS